jgi:predicted MPP superfamily phosphohydrolase
MTQSHSHLGPFSPIFGEKPESIAPSPSPTSRNISFARWIGRTWARLSYANQIEPTWLEHAEFPVSIKQLPDAFEGLRIAHLTDFHGGHHLPDNYLEEVIDRTLAAKPDLIALTGDYIHKGYGHVDSVAKSLGRLKAPLGTFAVLGNHDFSVRNALGLRRYPGLHQAIADALNNEGIRVLRNENVTLMREDSKLLLAGIDDLWSGECDPTNALKDICVKVPRLVLAHNPLTVDQMAGHRCDLMLSGHTHGGQINWPGKGRILLGRNSRRFAAGLYHHDQTHVYVNKGVGFGWRFRFNVRPEIALITLRKHAF